MLGGKHRRLKASLTMFFDLLLHEKQRIAFGVRTECIQMDLLLKKISSSDHNGVAGSSWDSSPYLERYAL